MQVGIRGQSTGSSLSSLSPVGSGLVAKSENGFSDWVLGLAGTAKASPDFRFSYTGLIVPHASRLRTKSAELNQQ